MICLAEGFSRKSGRPLSAGRSAVNGHRNFENVSLHRNEKMDDFTDKYTIFHREKR